MTFRSQALTVQHQSESDSSQWSNSGHRDTMELATDSPASQSGIPVKETLKLELLKTASRDRVEPGLQYDVMCH